MVNTLLAPPESRPPKMLKLTAAGSRYGRACLGDQGPNSEREKISMLEWFLALERSSILELAFSQIRDVIDKGML
jgi:hypothetical protein